jgi:hypothetical protein
MAYLPWADTGREPDCFTPLGPLGFICRQITMSVGLHETTMDVTEQSSVGAEPG